MPENGGERDRGILTEDDRAFLRGEKEFEHHTTESKTRGRVRKRIYNGLLDFVPIFEHLGEKDADRLVEKGDEDALDAVVATLAFVREVADRVGWDMEYLLEEAAKQYHLHGRTGRRFVEDVNYTEDLGERDLVETARRAERKRDRGALELLTDYEIRVLVLLGKRDILEDWRAALRDGEARKAEILEDIEQRLEMLGRENTEATTISPRPEDPDDVDE